MNILENLEQELEKLKKSENTVAIILGCYSIAMLDYRGPIGDKAFEFLKSKIGPDVLTGLMYLTGYIMGSKGETKDFERLLKSVTGVKENQSCS